MSAELDLDALLAFTIQLALDAGDIMRQGQTKRFAEGTGQAEKINAVDLVTEVDKATEAYIVKRIHDAYPDHFFIGEETYSGEKITDAPTWIVDPIDGTTNYVHGFPFCCTSIGLAVGGAPVVGVVYNPFLGHLYSAAKGRGAYLNQKIRLPITGRPMPLPDLSKALIAVEYGYNRQGPAMTSKTKTFNALAAHPDMGGKMCHSIRSLGTAALDTIMVATGGVDVYWEIGCWPWDMCAAIIIVTEAGGVVFGPKHGCLDSKVDAGLLAGRKFLVIRDIEPEEGETTLQAQQRIAKEFYETAEDYDP